MGNGLVALPAGAERGATETVPGGWVTVLQDCLDEGAPASFTVIDRAVPGETAKSARERVDGVVELSPGLVVVALGAQELGDESPSPARFKRDLQRLVDALRQAPRKPDVLLLGMVPPTLAQAGEVPGNAQQDIDNRTSAWNEALKSVASEQAGVRHVDLWSDWPRESGQRAGLTVNGWHLSDQGHARVGAAVCDGVMAAASE